MIRKLVCSMIALIVCIGLVTAEDFTAVIKKVEGKNVTFAKFNFKDKDKDKKPEEMTLPVAKDAKIVKGSFNFKEKKVETGDAIEGGLKSDTFAKIGEKGVFARITTSEDGKTITQIVVTQFGKKKKDSDK